jgi:hypothetical protein
MLAAYPAFLDPNALAAFLERRSTQRVVAVSVTPTAG